MLEKSSACIPKYSKIVKSTEKNGRKFYNSKDLVLPMNITTEDSCNAKGQGVDGEKCRGDQVITLSLHQDTD